MMLEPVQCNGKTKAGRRCRILAAQHDAQHFKNHLYYCGYHVTQAQNARQLVAAAALLVRPSAPFQCSGTMQTGRRCQAMATPQEALLLDQNQSGNSKVFFCNCHLAQDLARTQCSGRTHAGLRCKIRCPSSVELLENQRFYCHYHAGQELVDSLSKLSIQPAKPRPNLAKLKLKETGTKSQQAPVKESTSSITASAKPAQSQPAYIYAYTLDAGHSNAHVFEDGRFQPLASPAEFKKGFAALLKKARISTSAAERQAQPARTLIKIGYTTQTPTARLAQWQEKCRHSISLLAPSIGGRHYDYDFGVQGWPVKDPVLAKPIEGMIHKKLWALYGKGNVLCEGCVSPSAEFDTDTSKNGDKEDKARRNVHIEWFLIPNEKKAFETVYKVIEDCIRQGSA